MNKSYAVFKPEVINISLSSSMMARARCKHCQSAPKIYYYYRNPNQYKDVKVSNDLILRYKNNLTRFNRTKFNFAPKYIQGIGYLSHPSGWSRYRPKVHHTRGTHPNLDLVEVIACECMQTRWIFADKATKDRPEIFHRKSTRRFPFKFEF